MSQKPRRNFTPEQRASILRKHHVEKIPVSKICEEEDLQPSLFYNWQKQLFENAAAVFQPPEAPRIKELEKEVDTLKAKIGKKDEVIAEISEEYVALKKSRGAT